MPEYKTECPSCGKSLKTQNCSSCSSSDFKKTENSIICNKCGKELFFFMCPEDKTIIHASKMEEKKPTFKEFIAFIVFIILIVRIITWLSKC
jgi:predicted amidophosphoribosyltransferase